MAETVVVDTWRWQSLIALRRRRKEIELEKDRLDAEVWEIDQEIRTTQEAIRTKGRATQLLELQAKNEEPNYEAEGVADSEEANGKRYWHLMEEEMAQMEEMDASGAATSSHLAQDLRAELKSLKRKYAADHGEEYVEDGEEYVGGTELQDTFRSIYASNPTKRVKTSSEDDDLRQFPQDLDDHENPAEANAEDGEEEGEAAWTYARQWLKRNGADGGIPKKYSPCVYFFKASHGCQKEEKCHFSHNEEIFCEGPFAALLKDLSWGRKDVKRFRGAPPPPPPPATPLKKWGGKCD